MATVETITKRAEYALQELNIDYKEEYGDTYYFYDQRIPQNNPTDIEAKFIIGRYQFEIIDATLMLEEERNTELDNKILDSLTNDVSMMIRILNNKGTTTFQETEKFKKLRTLFVSLTGDMQFYKILPSEFHVSNGRMIKHLGAKE